MFTLVLLPCSDHSDLNESPIDVNFISAKEQHQHHNDMCSPFCFCACCSTFMNVIQLTATNFFSLPPIQNYARFEQLFFSLKHTFIWQPPKLA
jgi:hypothetical protein